MPFLPCGGDVQDAANDLGADVGAIVGYGIRHPDSTIGRGGLLNQIGALVISAGSQCEDRREKEGGVVIYENCGGLASLFLNTVDKQAFTVGSFVFANDELRPRLQRHELCHIPQWEFFGMWFIPQYLLISKNDFEREAGSCE